MKTVVSIVIGLAAVLIVSELVARVMVALELLEYGPASIAAGAVIIVAVLFGGMELVRLVRRRWR